MLRNVFLKSLRDRRRAMLWWSLGLGALTFVTLLFYPAIRDSPELTDLYDQLPEAAGSSSSPASSPTSRRRRAYLNTQLFVLMVPLLFIIFAITLGSGGHRRRGGPWHPGVPSLSSPGPLARSLGQVRRHGPGHICPCPRMLGDAGHWHTHRQHGDAGWAA